MRSKAVLEQDDVRRVVRACRDEARGLGLRVTIAVVDDGGHLCHLERMDGVKSTTVEVAVGKARTAASTWLPSGRLEERLKERPSLFRLRNLPMQGGMPLIFEGECVGGVGVSGADFDQDELIATAGAGAVEGD